MTPIPNKEAAIAEICDHGLDNLRWALQNAKCEPISPETPVAGFLKTAGGILVKGINLTDLKNLAGVNSAEQRRSDRQKLWNVCSVALLTVPYDNGIPVTSIALLKEGEVAGQNALCHKETLFTEGAREKYPNNWYFTSEAAIAMGALALLPEEYFAGNKGRAFSLSDSSE